MRLVATVIPLNMAVAAEGRVLKMPLAHTVAVPCMEQEAVVVVLALRLMEEMVAIGELIPLGPQTTEMAVLVTLELPVSSGAVAVVPEVLEPVMEVPEAHQAEVAGDKVTHLQVQVGVQEAKARCEYGPGNSEHRRTQRPGCAEA